VRNDCRIPSSKIRSIWTIYQAGFSTGWIAERIYRRYGYASPESCQAALFRAFRRRTLRPRDHRLAAHFRQDFNRGCGGCGCSLDERTMGCKQCTRRHSQRSWRKVSAPGRRSCAGCGGPMDGYTIGCRHCAARHYHRRWRAKSGPASSPRAENRDGGAALSPRKVAA
jgi:hypothetical protein